MNKTIPPLTKEKRKMARLDGSVKANMICATCAHYDMVITGRSVSRLCTKYNRAVEADNNCASYRMSQFFQRRGYKQI